MYVENSLTLEERVKYYEKTERYGYWILTNFFKELLHDEDAQQEMKLAIWQAAMDFDPERDIRFSAYCKKRVTDKIHELIYRVNHKEAIKMRIAQSCKEGPSYYEDEHIETLELLDFIERLPKVTKSIIDLRQQGYSQREIAQRLGLTDSKVSRELAKAKQLWNESEAA